MLDHEQNIESVQHHRVHAQEIRGENAVCLGAQEFSPARPFAARCRIDTGSFQNRPHRARRKLLAQATKFRHGSAGTPTSHSPMPVAAPTGAARAPCHGRRCGGVAAGSSVGSPGPAATARSCQG